MTGFLLACVATVVGLGLGVIGGLYAGMTLVTGAPGHVQLSALRLVQLLALPFVVGITYEFNRYVGGHDNPVTNFLARPGMWMQNFTTNEPDDSMLEVAIEAMKRVIPEEKGKDAW